MASPLLVDGCEINRWNVGILDELVEGGVTAVQTTCAVWEDTRSTLNRLMEWRHRFSALPDKILQARTTADIEEARRTGRVAIILGFQNAAPLEDDPRLVGLFHELGVRVMQLTYNAQNLLGSGCLEPTDGGLSRFGVRVVEEMNASGVLVDCSHVGDRTTRDAIDASSAPIALTHANPRWFCDHPRNAPDDVLRAVAKDGGVVGVTTYPTFIGGPEVTAKAFCDMVARLCDQIGVEHVAIGSDLSRGQDDDDLVELRNGRLDPNPPSATWPPWQDWFQTAQDFPALLSELHKVGFGDAEIDALAGRNWMKLYDRTFLPA